MDLSGRRARLVWALLLAALAGPLVACETKSVSIQLPSFNGGDIDGVWLWRRVETTGQYVRVCQILFSDPEYGPEGEFVRYAQSCDNGHDGLEVELKAVLSRPQGDPATVVFSFWYMRWEDSGLYRASAFNAAGESPLSAGVVEL